jgi:hypothetical protein
VTKPQPTLDGYVTFLRNVVGIPDEALPPVVVDPDIAPVLSETADGVLPATTYYVKYTYANSTGETLPSPESTLSVDADNVLVVASPAAREGATLWNVYVSTITSIETQQASGIALGTNWTEPVTGLIYGRALPTQNTTAAAVIQLSYALAIDTVNIFLDMASPQWYVLAVYNFAADRLVNYANDLTGQTYFTTLRNTLNLNTLSAGVVQSTSDNGTSVSFLNPDQLKNLMLSDLQQLKTPWGRQYLQIAQKWGTTLWGLT